MRNNLLIYKLKNRHKFFAFRENIGLKNFFVTSFIIVTFTLFTFFVSFLIYSRYIVSKYESYFNDPAKMLAYKSNTLTFYDRNGQLIYRTAGRYNTKLIPLDQISPSLIKATLAAEDKNFYQHDSFSVFGTLRAIWSDLEHKDAYYQGGSTITQQVARTLFLNNDKSFNRKIREIIIASEIERRYTKDQILDLYLNSIYYGADAYGVADASQTYFDKAPKDLDLSQASLLAGLAVAPSKLSPTTGDKDKAIERQHYILDLMESKNMVSKNEGEAAKSEPLVFSDNSASYTKAPHFVLMVKEELQSQFPNLDIDHSGMKVYTTLDLTMQERAESILSQTVSEFNYRNLTNGAFLATNPKTGEILAMAGSVDYNQPDWGAFNLLTGFRSPGSSIKPLIYAAALESGSITPATILHDQPTVYKNQWETFAPHDADNKWRGNVLPREALANSLNVPAVEVLAKTGLQKAYDTVTQLGITGLAPEDHYGLSFVVGGEEVRGIDLAAGYQVLDNGGFLIHPWGLVKVEDRFGNTIYQPQHEKKQVLDPRIGYILTNILADNKARAIEFGANSLLNLDRPAAVKTGTGQDFKNAWTIGYTPSLLGLVWVGNNDQSPMVNIWGVESAGLIWHNFMSQTLANSSVENFIEPAGLETADICSIDGSKAANGTPTSQEIFIDGTSPKNDGSCILLADKKHNDDLALAAAEDQKRNHHKQDNPPPPPPDNSGAPVDQAPTPPDNQTPIPPPQQSN